MGISAVRWALLWLDLPPSVSLYPPFFVAVVSAWALDVRRVVFSLPSGHVNALWDLSTYTPTRLVNVNDDYDSTLPPFLPLQAQPFSLSLKLPRPRLQRLQRAFMDDVLNPDLFATLNSSSYSLFLFRLRFSVGMQKRLFLALLILESTFQKFRTIILNKFIS